MSKQKRFTFRRTVVVDETYVIESGHVKTARARLARAIHSGTPDTYMTKREPRAAGSRVHLTLLMEEDT